MSMTATGTYDGTVIRLDGPVALEANTRVRITVEAVPPATSPCGFLETAMSLQVSGPRDWATNFEKYLHGPLASDE